MAKSKTSIAPKRRGRPPGSGKKAAAAKPARRGASAISIALKKAIEAKGLSLTAAAKTIGVALPGLVRILGGKAKTNVRTTDKYAAFLSGKPLGRPAKKRGRPAKKRGRPAKI